MTHQQAFHRRVRYWLSRKVHRAGRTRRRFWTLPNLQALLMFVGFVVLVLGAIGGAHATLKELITTGIGVVVLSAIVLGSLAYALLFRRDLRLRAATENAGTLPSTRYAGPLRSLSQCDEIHRLAQTEFGSDAMSLRQIRRLHWTHRADVAVAYEDGEMRGYFAVLAPTPELIDRMMAAPEDPTKWRPKDFLSTPSRWSRGSFYVESVVVAGGSNVFVLLLDYLLRPIQAALDMPGAPASVFVCGFGSTDEGRRLFERELMLPVHFTGERTDWAPFYAGHVSVQQVVALGERARRAAARSLARA
jgi:hypothetical protein